MSEHYHKHLSLCSSICNIKYNYSAIKGMIYKKQLVVQWQLCVPGCENELRFEAVPEAFKASRFLSSER